MSSFKQNSELLTEGELRSNIDESDKVRDLQDKVADLKAEVYKPSKVAKYSQSNQRKKLINFTMHLHTQRHTLTNHT